MTSLFTGVDIDDMIYGERDSIIPVPCALRRGGPCFFPCIYKTFVKESDFAFTFFRPCDILILGRARGPPANE